MQRTALLFLRALHGVSDERKGSRSGREPFSSGFRPRETVSLVQPVDMRHGRTNPQTFTEEKPAYEAGTCREDYCNAAHFPIPHGRITVTVKFFAPPVGLSRLCRGATAMHSRRVLSDRISDGSRQSVVCARTRKR